MTKYSISDLNEMYVNSEGLDKDIFSEMRSNVLLVAGEHYSKRLNKYFNRLRNTNRLQEQQRLRLTKNHVHRIVRHYEDVIIGAAPGVVITPQNDKDMQDRKDAELNSAVWEEAKERYSLKEEKRKWIHHFVELGEVCIKMFWDPNEGDLVGYEPIMNEQTGDPERDQLGEYAPDKEKPVFSGDFIFEPVFGFDLLRDPYAKCMRTSRYHIVRKMANVKELKTKYADDEKKLGYITASEDETFLVFDSARAQYAPNKTELLVKEYYFKPSYEFPNGYYYIATEGGILEEGELPYGIYPLVWQGFDEHATAPRARSIIKVARPYQAEINRASSQLATHQITIGDDKIIYQGGTKLAPGALLPGVRGITFQGQAPQILPGRNGSQFLPYIDQQIKEMYQACRVDEIGQDENTGQLEPFALLYRSASQKKKYRQYIEKFEFFEKAVCEKYLTMAKVYLPEDRVIQAIGKNEVVNISEFKATGKLCYEITVEAKAEDVDTMLGKQMTLTNVLQYVGKQLKNDDIGRILKSMPYVGEDHLFDDLTINQEMVDNDMLAIERGEQPTLSPYADNEYYVNRLTHRMKQASFSLLPPEQQQVYDQLLMQHEGEIKRKIDEAAALKDGMIPVEGAMITCSMHLPDPGNPGSTKQLRLPYSTLDWVVKTLEKQGRSMEVLENMNEGAAAQMGALPPPQQQQMGGAVAPQGQLPSPQY